MGGQVVPATPQLLLRQVHSVGASQPNMGQDVWAVRLGKGVWRIQCAPLTDTGLGRWHSVLLSNLGVTEVGCSELRKTGQLLSLNCHGHGTSGAGQEQLLSLNCHGHGTSGAGLGQRLQTVMPAEGRGRV